ncbi:UNVERIFIED_CONTAM: Major facilitator superfamily domain-containing protein 6 [Trichonephila clavipes]
MDILELITVHRKDRTLERRIYTFETINALAEREVYICRWHLSRIVVVASKPIVKTEYESLTSVSCPQSTVFAQTTRQLPEWLSVLRTFANLRYGAFLYVTWFMGFGIGLVFTFLFWHLQDLGGTSTLFGVASVINHISEIFAYFFSFKFIRQIGHTKVSALLVS